MQVEILVCLCLEWLGEIKELCDMLCKKRSH